MKKLKYLFVVSLCSIGTFLGSVAALGVLVSPQVQASFLQEVTSSSTEATVNPFISQQRQLTFSGPRAGEGYFSADGQMMIFQSERSQENPFYQMFVLNLKTGKTTRLSPGYGQTTCGWIHPQMKKALWASTHLDPKWKETQAQELENRKSPIQKRYSWSFDPMYDIFESDLTGKSLKRLTKEMGYDAEGSYSPDGKWIAFASNRTGYTTDMTAEDKKIFEKDPSSQMEIYIMKADGTQVRRLTRAIGYDGGPFFSHDGKKITWRRFSADGGTAEIWTMNVDGSEQKQITRLGKMSWAPFFHPSGDYIIFGSNIEGHSNFELYIVDSQGEKEPVRVTFEPGFDGLATFSPDGKYLTWTHRNEKGESQIYLGLWNDLAARGALKLPASKPQFMTLKKELTEADLRTFVQYLSSDEMEGRSTGSAQEKMYSAQVASLFKTWGLVPAPGFQDYFQEFDFVSGVRFGPQNALKFQSADPQALSKVRASTLSQNFEPLSLSKSGTFPEAEVVFVGYGLRSPATDQVPAYDSYEGLDVKGKWVLALQDVPQDVKPEVRFHYNQFGRVEFKATVAKNEGALGLILVTGPRTNMVQRWGKPKIEGSPQDSGLAVLKVSTELGSQLFASQGLNLDQVQQELDQLTKKKDFSMKSLKAQAQVDLILDRAKGRNVVGVLKAPRGQKSLALIVGAHGDHLGRGLTGNSLARKEEVDQIHNGADDNASGVAVVMELAHYFSQNKQKAATLQKDLYFAVWSGEEIGLLGSKSWLKEWSEKNGPPSKTFAANLNLDMVGRLRDKLIVQGAGSSILWAPYFEEMAVKSGLPLTLVEDPYLPTDSTAFYLEKIPGVSFFTGSHSEYHSPRDQMELVNFDGLQRISQLSAQWIEGLASLKSGLSYREVPQSRRNMGQRTFRIFLGTIPDYSQDQVKGVRLGGVSKDSPAEKGGLKAQDVIVEMAGQKIENLYDYTFVLQSLKPGSEIAVKVMRMGQVQELKLVPAVKE